MLDYFWICPHEGFFNWYFEFLCIFFKRDAIRVACNSSYGITESKSLDWLKSKSLDFDILT